MHQDIQKINHNQNKAENEIEKIELAKAQAMIPKIKVIPFKNNEKKKR